MKLLIPLELNLPPQVQITGYELHTSYYGYPEIDIEFETSQFKGFINTQLYADKTALIPQEGTIIGSYKYSSPLDWLWNNFEFNFKNPQELSRILNQILSGTPLIEEAQYRKKAPKDVPNEFTDGYGPEVYKDILKAYRRLFFSPKLAQKSKESVLTAGG